MTMSEAQSWAVIIAAFGGMIISVVAACGSVLSAWLTAKGNEKQEMIVGQLGEVHEQTNSRLAMIDAELSSTKTELRAARLELVTTREELKTALLSSLTVPPPRVEP